MLKSFYNPDEQQALEYHKELLKMADQERLAHQFKRASASQHKSQHARTSLAEHFLHLFNLKPNRNALALKDHK